MSWSTFHLLACCGRVSLQRGDSSPGTGRLLAHYSLLFHAFPSPQISHSHHWRRRPPPNTPIPRSLPLVHPHATPLLLLPFPACEWSGFSCRWPLFPACCCSLALVQVGALRFSQVPLLFFFSLLKLLASCISTDGDSPLGLGVQRLEFTEAESVPTNVILGERAMTIYNFAFFFFFLWQRWLFLFLAARW